MNGPSEMPYDFEERARLFALRVRAFLKKLPRTIANAEDGKQLIRASGSIGANYIEANDPLGEKDMIMRLRIARKEARESRHWLLLLDVGESEALELERSELVGEAVEEVRILSSMVKNARYRSIG